MGISGMGGPQFRAGMVPANRYGYGRPQRGDSIDEDDETAIKDSVSHQQRQQQSRDSNTGQQPLQQHNRMTGGGMSARVNDRSQDGGGGVEKRDLGHRVDSSSTCGSEASQASSPVVSKGQFPPSGGGGETVVTESSVDIAFPGPMDRASSNEVDDIISPFAFGRAPVDGSAMTASHNYSVHYGMGMGGMGSPPVFSPPAAELCDNNNQHQTNLTIGPSSDFCDGPSFMQPIRTGSTDSAEGFAARSVGMPSFPNKPFFRRNRSGDSTASPRRIEMSHLRQNRSRSLLYDSVAATSVAGGGSHMYASSVDGFGSGGDMPSVLMSVLRAENIDYENDFYWLNKFNHERRHRPQSLEQSMQKQMQRQHQQSLGGGAFSPNIMRGSAAGLRLHSSSSPSTEMHMQDIYGTASAFLSESNRPNNFPPQLQQHQQFQSSSSSSRPYQGRAALSKPGVLDSPVISRNTFGASSSSGGGNGEGHRQVSAGHGRRPLSSVGLAKLSESDDPEGEEEAGV